MLSRLRETVNVSMAVLAVALILSPVGPSMAGDKDGRYAIKGAGRMSCERFLAARDDKNADLLIYGGWIEGYLTAVNNYEKSTYDLAPWQSTDLILGLVARGCENNREAKFLDVVAALFLKFYPQRLDAESMIGKVELGEKGIFIYRAILMRAQEALNGLGYDAGEVNGLAGEKTLNALVAYQKDKGLKETGLPDQQTLYALLFQGVLQ